MALLMKGPLTIVILSEMNTGCVGGVCDSVCNEVPLLLRRELTPASRS
ncbi:hypothetical protein [Afipia sp. P52-10]